MRVKLAQDFKLSVRILSDISWAGHLVHLSFLTLYEGNISEDCEEDNTVYRRHLSQCLNHT